MFIKDIQYDNDYVELNYNRNYYYINLNKITFCPSKWSNYKRCSYKILMNTDIKNVELKKLREKLGIKYDGTKLLYDKTKYTIRESYDGWDYDDKIWMCDTNNYETYVDLIVENDFNKEHLFRLECTNTIELCDKQLEIFKNKWIKANKPNQVSKIK